MSTTLAAPVPRAARRHLPRGCFPALGALVVLLLIGIGYGAFFYFTAWPHVSAGQAHLDHALSLLRGDSAASLTSSRLENTRAELQAAGSDFATVRTLAGPFLVIAPALGWVPSVGGDISQAPGLLNLAVDACDLGTALIDAAAPAVAALQTPVDTSGGQPQGMLGQLSPVLTALEASPDTLARARVRLDAVQADRAEIDGSGITIPRLQSALAQLDAQVPLLDQALSSLDGLPHAVDTLLGRDQPFTFLVLAQNEDELRPTGGFISAVGLLTIDGGKFTNVEFRDSYAVDNPKRPALPPPPDMTRFMGATQWFIRDANWAPDFPQTAKTAEQFYQLDQGVSVDGTMAVDQRMVALLLRALGPLTLPGYPDSITAGNVVDLMRHYFQPTPGSMSDAWWAHRKDFMRDLFHALAEQLHTLPRDRLVSFAGAMQQGLDQKDVQISVHDPATARWLHTLGWDGSIGTAPGDALAVVDMNMGFNKVNANVASRMLYTMTLSTDPAHPNDAALSITYRNRSPASDQPCVQQAIYKDSYDALTQGCYWDYVRVYAPAGSTLLDAHWGDQPLSVGTVADAGRTSFTGFFVLPAGQEQTLSLHYTVPYTATRTAGANSYGLTLRKQPGSDQVLAGVTVRLPTGATLHSAQPTVEELTGGWVRYDVRPLNDDRRLTLGW